MRLLFFFFNDTATTEIYTLSLHDALPIWALAIDRQLQCVWPGGFSCNVASTMASTVPARSEEHTSELQSQSNLVCRLLLEKKKMKNIHHSKQQQDSEIMRQQLTQYPAAGH